MNKLEILRLQILSQNPTDQQKNAIFADELEFLLRASPGSGKTWTSCRRFIWRGANWSYSAGGLALLSFTNAAIREFHAATIDLGRRDLLSDPNYVGTFDAFVERFILAPFGHLIIGSTKRPRLFTAPRPGDWKNEKLLVLTELKNGKKLKVPAWEIIPYPVTGKASFRASSGFGGAKVHFALHDPVKEFLRVGYYTHAQRVFWSCQLLFDRPHIAKLIARRFPEIVVDEAQDTNVWLLILLNLLRERGTKVTLIGDPDQCIYEFSMADAASLAALRDKWNIPEKPLSQSFRCHNQIAAAVRNIGGNPAFDGRGDGNNHQRAFVIREAEKGFAHSIGEFERALERAGIAKAASAILCRAHQQLESIRGEVIYTNLKGLTKDLAQASFFRDCRKDYKRAFQIVERSVRLMAEDSDLWQKVDEYLDSEEAHRVALAIWRFVKSSSGLPSVSLSGTEWISRLRENITKLISELGIKEIPHIGQKIKKTGLNDSQMTLPLFVGQSLFPPIRQETIHQVKGESIDAVLVLGSAKFFNAAVESVSRGTSSEDRRLAYVAMTRARYLLVVALPAAHFDKHVQKWKDWGFGVM
jgi:UvrD/REP helicase N-terminal domain/UvrD-like helicase C-terminal domain